jgi:MFS family permease
LGLLWFGAAFLLALFFFYDRRPRNGDRAEAQSAEPAPRLREIFLSVSFFKLAGVVFVVMTLFSAYVVHLAPALVKGGLGLQQAAEIAGSYGVASLVGKLVTGWAFDRAPMRLVTTVAMGLLILGCVLATLVDGNALVGLGTCVSVGLSAGAMYAMMPCVTARIYPAQHFGVVYGVLTSALSLAAAAGPLAAGFMYDAFGSYDPGFWAGVPLAVLAGLVLATLKPERSRAA